MVAVEVPYGNCRRTNCPVYYPLDRIQTLLVDKHWVILDPAQWAINRADGPSVATVRALHGYHTAPPRLPYGTSMATRTAPPQLQGLIFQEN